MSGTNRNAHWKGDRLYLGTRLSGYSITRDQTYFHVARPTRPSALLPPTETRPLRRVILACEFLHGGL